MKRLVSLLSLASLVSLFGADANPTARPNIVLILADDLGYADVGFTGGKEIRTPNLDDLARRGLRLDQHYVQPVCSPTRGAYLTGRYPMRYGLQVGVIRPWEPRGLPLEERTLPQALKQAGYTTAIVGKWHLGLFTPKYLPTRRGFDHQYGHYCGAIDYFTHMRDSAFDWHRDDKVCRDEGYSTHLIAREAVRLVRQQPKDKPLFLYVPFNAVHSPHQVPEKYKEPYAHLKEPRRTYAGMLAAMDEAIGQIVAALDDRGMRTNTLFIFSSDNGGPAPGRVTDNGPLRAGKGTVYEGGVRVCAFATWEGHLPAGKSIPHPTHAVDLFPTLLKLTGASLEQSLPLDGTDIWPVLARGATPPAREILLNTTPNGGAVRVGDWKLVVNGRGGAADADEEPPAPKAKKKGKAKAAPASTGEPRLELFNLAADLGEKNDLSTAQPAKLKELKAIYDRYAGQAAAPANVPMPAGFKPPKVWGETD